MTSRCKGTHVFSWSQTEIDGLEAAPIDALSVGAVWSWFGSTTRVDGPNGPLILENAIGEDEWRSRAAKAVRKLMRTAKPADVEAVPIAEDLTDAGFAVTNGARTYTITIIDIGLGRAPLLMCLGELPPRGQELWVVDTIAPARRPVHAPQGVICFAPGTRMLTPTGIKLVEDLREGDWLQTKDNGAQPVQWVGSETYSGAHLFAQPALRPIRLRANTLGIGRPDHDLVISPEHRLLVQGRAAQRLFNTDEILVMAKDLVDGRGVSRDLTAQSVTYIHVLMPRHEVLFANGIETESFHPADASFAGMSRGNRHALCDLFPGVVEDPYLYGGHARRVLSRPEAAILMHAA
ncbi:Hint domain-containing protein [Pseudoprimorskyibacter insulae]|uniref:Hedgehog/Intein (Hint) domain-containing protein n=1 Tax=Pseudoprimorskyibacter insulae TaxID=1695997 RepID=A0A2R8APD8_9RHOB|nr:Hint domain-containing protein [Pseudoprimorskyibacter insulae]SPF77936.1 hypothetical protein PRI8871_00524 [Pseudoprimorskyibacter insulae]